MPSQTMTIDAAAGDGYKGAGSYFDNSLSLIGSSGVYGYWRMKIATTIPQGATISVGTFTAVAANTRSGSALNTDFYFNNSTNPATPTSAADLTGATYTTSKKNYAADGQTIEDVLTFDVKTPLQELVNARTLTAGEYVILTNQWISGSIYHQFYNYETNPAKAGKLDVTWSTTTTAPLPAGAVSFSGVAATTRKKATASIGMATILGVAPTSYAKAPLPAGQTAIAGAPQNEIQEINFGGATSGNLFISCPGVFGFAVQSVTASAAQWQTAINNTATVTAIAGGIRFTFDQPPNQNTDVAPISIDINTSDGTPTVSHLIHGRGYPLTVRKEAPAPTGSVTFTGVGPAATHQAPLAVGSVTLTGVTPGVSKVAALAIGSVTFTGVAVNTRMTAELSIGTVTITGVAPTAISAGAILFAAADHYKPGFHSVTVFGPGFRAASEYAPGFRAIQGD